MLHEGIGPKNEASMLPLHKAPLLLTSSVFQYTEGDLSIDLRPCQSSGRESAG